MDISTLLILLLGGGLGFVLGLLGGGGALLAIPVFLYVLQLPFRVSVGASLAVVFVGALPAVGLYIVKKQIRWRAVLVLGIAGALGSWAGAHLAMGVSATLLRVVLVGLMIASSMAMLKPSRVPLPEVASAKLGPLALAGVGIGLLTGMVGVGGGFLLVPALILLGNLVPQQAVATSLVVIVVNAAVGGLGYGAMVQPYWPVLWPLVISVPLAALFGAWVSQKVPSGWVKKGFGILLWILVALMVWNPGH